MGAPRPYSRPPGPHLRGTLLRSSAKFPARKARSACLRLRPGPLGPCVGGNLPLVRFKNCAWVCRANGTGANPGGRPKGLPYPTSEGFLENRRGGACPSRGPVWDRPLRNGQTVPGSPQGRHTWAARMSGTCPAKGRGIAPLLVKRKEKRTPPGGGVS